ncbi:MAG: DUF4874 domain-containing protein, partial [Lentisphaeria bacterium]|nr:DUF4874 domain-containing protein [Lentisphaeria bacterium]
MDRKCPGPTKDDIRQHLKDLTPLIRKNADIIYVWQAGFIGAWGEWHSSRRYLETDAEFKAELLATMLEVLPDNRMIMVRVPRYKREALELLDGVDASVLTEETAFSGTPAARIGHFNDGLLASDTCGGTFPDPPYSNPGNRDYDQFSAESLYLPVDGELFWNDVGGVID